MNYEKIYNSLIQKRRIYKIDRTPTNLNVEYHHIIPRTCNGIDDPRDEEHNNKKYNIVGLTLKEHFFAHLLLVKIYYEKYGCKHKYYKNMLKAVVMLGTYKKYQIKTSKLYDKFKTNYYKANLHKTTTGRKWVTNGTTDIFLKVGEQIPDGFYSGRSYGGGEKLKQFGLKISERGKGRTPWNKGKHGCYSDEYRKKISENHADISGENNVLFGGRMMFDIKTQTQVFVYRNDIQKYLDMGYVEKRKLKIYNNGKIDILSDVCPDGFIEGSFKCKVYWWNNGIIEKMCKKQPGKDFKMGRLKNKRKINKLIFMV